MEEGEYSYSGSIGGIDGRVQGVVIDHANRPGNGERASLFDRVSEVFIGYVEGLQDLTTVNEALAAYGDHVGFAF